MNVYIETYGCQMNKLDSETVASILVSAGHTMVGDMHEADLILLNTCGVRENAERRIHGRVAELSSLRAGHEGLLFGVIGCMAQRLGSRLLSHVVSIVAGPDSYRRLPDMIAEASDGRIADTVFNSSEMYDDIEPVRAGGYSAWVAVNRGCNNFCSYCIVPYTRGRERSIPVGRIIGQIQVLRREGYREITLLGQNVNSYRDGGVDFAELLRRTSDTGIEWIRFLTSHPADLTEDILRVMGERENICNHLHLPVQSGSEKILAAMRRRYTLAHYLGLVDMARGLMDNPALSTDMIFGFPGETDGDYEASIDLLERVGYDYAFLYRYSERAGTLACSFGGSVPEKVRIERLKNAIALQMEITGKRHKAEEGSVHTVLLKGPSKEGNGWFGFSEKSIPVVVRGTVENAGSGVFVKVRITGTTGASLIGEPVIGS